MHKLPLADYLKDEGSYEETSAVAVKRVLAWQLEEAMRKEGMTKNQMAKRMHTAAANWTESSIRPTTRSSSIPSSRPRMFLGAT